MDLLFRTIAMIVILIGIPIGIIVFVLWITRKYGRRILGYWIVGIIVFLLMLYPASFVLEDILFFKKDVNEILGEHNIELYDDFKINYHKMSGIRDFTHEFEVTISDSDRTRIIQQFMDSASYTEKQINMFDIRDGKPRYSEVDTFFYKSFQNESFFELQYYQPNRKGITPQWDRIQILKSENILEFRRILD